MWVAYLGRSSLSRTVINPARMDSTRTGKGGAVFFFFFREMARLTRTKKKEKKRSLFDSKTEEGGRRKAFDFLFCVRFFSLLFMGFIKMKDNGPLIPRVVFFLQNCKANLTYAPRRTGNARNNSILGFLDLTWASENRISHAC